MRTGASASARAVESAKATTDEDEVLHGDLLTWYYLPWRYPMRLIIGAICIAALAGCHSNNNTGDGGGGFGGGGGGGGSGGVATLKPTIGLDLAHITGFAITGGVAARRVWPEQASDGGVTSMMSTLYAVDDQGNFIETTLTSFSSDGTIDSDLGTSFDLSTTTRMRSVTPTAIFNTPKHVVFQFHMQPLTIYVNGPAPLKNCTAVIMRKTDGGLFCFDGNFPPEAVDSDGADQLFLRQFSLARVDMSGATPQSTILVDSMTGTVGEMVVNHDADALCDIGSGGAMSTLRVIKKNGGLQNISASGSRLMWLSSSGHDFYYVNGAVSMNYPILLLTRQADGSFVSTQQGTLMYLPSFVVLTTPTQLYAWRQGPSAAETGIEEILGANQGRA